jgi:hypothetical protein
MDRISDVQNPQVRPISDRTKSNYLGAVKNALRRSIAQRTTDWEEPALVTLTEVVRDFLDRTDLAPSTRVLMHSAFLWYIRSGETPHNDDSRAALALLEATPPPKSSKKQKSTIAKTIPQGDLRLLLDELQGRAAIQRERGRISWSYKTAIWLQCALDTGLRPIEWLQAEWADEEKTTLRVHNAKVKLSEPAFQRQATSAAVPSAVDIARGDNPSGPHTGDHPERAGTKTDTSDKSHPELARPEDFLCEDHIPSNTDWEINPEESNTSELGAVPQANQTGDTHTTRLIPIHGTTLRGFVETHLNFIAEAAPVHLSLPERQDLFRKYHLHCNTTLHRACQRIWKGTRSYALYTMRGQFSANMKASVGTTATAGLMGHSSPDSPSTGYYGKAQQAHGKYRARAGSKTQTQQEVGELARQHQWELDID